MTLKEHLFNLPDEVFAEFLVKTNEYQYSNYYCEYEHTTTDGKCFENCSEAIDHQVELLNSEYENE